MEPTREIFGNITGGEYIYLIALASVLVFFLGLFRRARLWRLGGKPKRPDRIWERLLGLFHYGFCQTDFFRDFQAGLAHLLMFIGFGAALIATALIAVQEDLGYLGVRLHFLKGNFYLWYSLLGDLLMALGVVGILYAAFRRYILRPSHLNQKWDDGIALLFLLVIFVTGFWLEGLRIAGTELRQHPDWALWSPVGRLIALGVVSAGMEDLLWHHRLWWWIHVIFSFGLIAYLGWSKLDHIIFSPLAIFYRNLKARTAPAYALINFEDEKVESFGTSRLKDLSWKDLLDLNACTRCGRCEAQCPAHLSGTPLSPMKLIQDLKRHMTLYAAAERDGKEGLPSLIESVDPEAVWSCRTCGACQEECPVFIEHIPKIVGMRRHQVLMESKAPEGALTFMKSLDERMHPWKGTKFSREDWMQGLSVRRLSKGERADLLYWIGCTGAMVDRNMKTTRAMIGVLQAAGVDFAVLGSEEVCTGDPARRAGNEYTFQMLARKNIETFQKYGVKKILTHCPHCFNTFKNEYPALGGTYEVIHHSQLLSELVSCGRVPLKDGALGRVTYHDACYLGRHNGVYEAPREVVGRLPGAEVVEMSRSRSRGLCCGAGGGFAWMEDVKFTARANQIRVDDAVETGASTVALACPFCMQMFEDGLKTRNVDDRMRARDLAELVAESLAENP